MIPTLRTLTSFPFFMNECTAVQTIDYDIANFLHAAMRMRACYPKMNAVAMPVPQCYFLLHLCSMQQHF
jgi:hypothetical protein